MDGRWGAECPDSTGGLKIGADFLRQLAPEAQDTLDRVLGSIHYKHAPANADSDRAKVAERLLDALARLQLAARRRGCQVRLRNASPGLRELVAFMGLDDGLTQRGEPNEPGHRHHSQRDAGAARPRDDAPARLRLRAGEAMAVQIVLGKRRPPTTLGDSYPTTSYPPFSFDAPAIAQAPSLAQRAASQ